MMIMRSLILDALASLRSILQKPQNPNPLELHDLNLDNVGSESDRLLLQVSSLARAT